MFCPRCSQPQPSDDLRFCPRCGFPLDTVKELVGREDERAGGKSESNDGGLLPRQKDISTGALVMFAGAVVATLWGFMEPRWPADVVLPQAYLILGLTLAFVLTLFHPLLRALRKLYADGETAREPSRRQRDGINLGALLMFVAALKAMLLATYAGPAGSARGITTLVVITGALLLLLVLRPLLRGVHGLFFKGDAETSATRDEEPDLQTRINPPREAALPPAQSIPVSDFVTPRANTAELAAPPSVTEETTRRLG